MVIRLDKFVLVEAHPHEKGDWQVIVMRPDGSSDNPLVTFHALDARDLAIEYAQAKFTQVKIVQPPA